MKKLLALVLDGYFLRYVFSCLRSQATWADRRTKSIKGLRKVLSLTMTDNKFAVDCFPKGRSRRIEKISGWYLLEEGKECAFQVWLCGRPLVSLLRNHRHDVAAVFPDVPNAVKSGFMGDVIIPEEIKAGEQFTLSLRAIFAEGLEILATEILELNDEDAELKVRKTNVCHLLCDPLSGESVIKLGASYFTASKSKEIPTIAGVPHFSPDTYPSAVRLTEEGSTHPYSEAAQELIDGSRERGFVLDFGSGVQTVERLAPHVINMDAIQFPYVDVVNTCQSLPFRDGVFEAVVSQAVFEHLPDPFYSAREIYRVLRPGGMVLIDTAFMQPFHGDPDHYFNMTPSGLREIMRNFDIKALGVRPYQNPSLGLIMQIETLIPFIRNTAWSRRLKKILNTLRTEGGEFDACLGEAGREVIAAGVYVLAKKPG